MLNDLINVLFCPESNLSISFIIFLSGGRLDIATFVQAFDIFFTSISMLASSSSSLLLKYVYTVRRLLPVAWAMSFIVMLPMPWCANSLLATLIISSLVSIVDIYNGVRVAKLQRFAHLCKSVQVEKDKKVLIFRFVDKKVL